MFNVASLLGVCCRRQKTLTAKLSDRVISSSSSLCLPLAVQIGWESVPELFSFLDSKICLADLLFAWVRGAFPFERVSRRKPSIYVPASHTAGGKPYSL